VTQPNGQPRAGEQSRDAGPALQQLVMRAWCEVLDTDELGPDDDFFDIGASSLDAVRIVARLEEDLAVELSVRVLLEARTVREMARRLHEMPR
jgi:acyl carrier protein